jgi:hypothetical protein
VAITSFEITGEESNKLLQIEEGHFSDAKAIEIAPESSLRLSPRFPTQTEVKST